MEGKSNIMEVWHLNFPIAPVTAQLTRRTFVMVRRIPLLGIDCHERETDIIVMHCVRSSRTWMLEHSHVEHLTVYVMCPVRGLMLSGGHVEHVVVYIGHPPCGPVPARGYVEHPSDVLC